MAIQRVFKNYMTSAVYMFTSGKSAIFIGGRFLTSDQAEIAELDNEVKSGNPFIYIDTNDSQVDTGLEEALNAAKAKAVEEVLINYNKETKIVSENNQTNPEDVPETIDSNSLLTRIANAKQPVVVVKSTK
jgi:hypothetical protein